MTVYEDEERGFPPYHPVMLTKVLVCAVVALQRVAQFRPSLDYRLASALPFQRKP
jgi:hypothetical protein